MPDKAQFCEILLLSHNPFYANKWNQNAYKIGRVIRIAEIRDMVVFTNHLNEWSSISPPYLLWSDEGGLIMMAGILSLQCV